MKNLAVLVVYILCSKCSFSQDSLKSFTVYNLNIPGSAIQCKMMPVKAGSFLMGSNATEKNRKPDEGPQRNIDISAFWMDANEVTRDAFDIFYADQTTSENSKVDAVTRPSPQYIDFSKGMGKEGGYPVNSLSQYAAIMYCRWLYTKTGIFYRLPTEAEWEYACRAGSTTTYYFGNDEKQLEKYAWFNNNSNQKFQKTGLKLPNAWGLYDMLGNVSEWTLDHYQERRMDSLQENTADPFVKPSMSRYPKSVRGGSFNEEANELRSAARFKSDPSWNRRDPQIPKSKWWLTDASSVGFRIICPFKQPDKEEANNFYKQYLGN